MRLLALLLLAAPTWAGVDSAARAFEERTAVLRPGVRQDFRMGAAVSLRQRHPDLSRRFVELTLTEIREAGQLTESAVMRKLAALAPDDLVGLLPRLKPDASGPVLNQLVYAKQTPQALRLFRDKLSRRDLAIHQANPLLGQLLEGRPDDAVALFRDIVAAFPFAGFRPDEGWALMNCARSLSSRAPEIATDAAERLANAAASPDIFASAARDSSYSFEIGGKPLAITDPREMILLMAGDRLHELAPERFGRHRALFTAWKFDQPLTVKSIRPLAARTPQQGDDRERAILQRMQQLRKLGDAERSEATRELAERIRALPAGASKTDLATSLSNLSTEGDLGTKALVAVAETLSRSLQETPPSSADRYVQLATMIRYEGLDLPRSDVNLLAADALLALREEIHREAGFMLTGLDGAKYSLSGLKGKVVLLNFWATWCPPCRKEMPDLERLHGEFAARGLVIVAVSDEDRETVQAFVKKEGYRFPIALDPDRKTQSTFDVDGIPKTFLFDRDGRLVSQAMDMRTERQLREMLKHAGL